MTRMIAQAKSKQIAVAPNTAAQMLAVSLSTVNRLMKSGELRASKINRRVPIRLDDIEKMLARHPIQPTKSEK
jgi:excisionase family DNA binding protein